MPKARELPRIGGVETVASTDLFRVESLNLEFGNGATRRYERLAGSRGGAVILVPMPDEETVLLVREYACGIHAYEVGLPKGRFEANESLEECANRELKEEIGYGARRLEHINTFTLAPAYMGHRTHVVLARNLYEERLPGDEPEPLEVIPWPLDRLTELAARDDCTEGRTLAALFLVKAMLEEGRL